MEIGVTIQQPPIVYHDNVRATFICANLVFHSQMKHIALEYHFICVHIQHALLRIAHVSTRYQWVDALEMIT